MAAEPRQLSVEEEIRVIRCHPEANGCGRRLLDVTREDVVILCPKCKRLHHLPITKLAALVD